MSNKVFVVEAGTTHVDHLGNCIKLDGHEFLIWSRTANQFLKDTSGWARIFYPLDLCLTKCRESGYEVKFK